MDLKKLLIILGAVIIALAIFQAGILVGYRQANFAGRFDDNYHRLFGPPRGLLNDHGAIGKIISVNLPLLVVNGPNGMEQAVLVGTSTIIRSGAEAATVTDLKPDTVVAVLGEPNDAGQIVAKFIRLLPPNAQN